MRKGIVKISRGFLQDALGFPPSWNIEEISLNKQGDIFVATISGDDFPEVIEIKECEILFHTRETRAEVRISRRGPDCSKEKV